MSQTNFQEKLGQSLENSGWKTMSSLVGLSGGADSTALALALGKISQSDKQFQGQLALAHVNHGLRGEQSDVDEEFVVSLAEKIGLPVHVHRADPPPVESSIEEYCRDERYEYFSNLASKLGARIVMTAHTTDDQFETILFRLFRGTSISGLEGIPRVRPLAQSVSMLRPLLDFSRREVIDYLHEQGQGFRNDVTNQDNKFNRNWLRNELIPKIRTRFGEDVDRRVNRMAGSVRDLNRTLEQVLEAFLDDCSASIDPQETVIGRAELQQLAPEMLSRVLVQIWKTNQWPRGDYTAQHWQQLSKLILGSEKIPGVDFPGFIRLSIEHKQVKLTRTG